MQNNEVGKNGLCIYLNHFDIIENENRKKCKIKDYEDNLIYTYKFYGYLEILDENCLRCDG